MTSSSIKISNQQFDFVTGLDSYSFFRTFPDWLSISFPCSQTPLLGVLDLLGKKSPFQVKPRGKSKTLYMFDNGGTLFVTEEATYQNLSFSGQLLAMLRDSHLDAEFITLLRSHPHNVTRLDVALDVPLAGSSVIRSLRAKFPDGVADIAGRSRRLRFQTCSDYYDPRLETGTVYFQTRTYGGYVKLKVYDKIHQLLDEN
ncbi:MAG: hypothetical protein V2I33_25300, partial [Kangiellaceae bacterium]|nr:hypothetical protein [Kangiellaceae bacterium]